MRLLGAVLAGGRSRRFGSDKAMAVLHGRTLLDHARDALTGWTEQVVLCGREGGLADRPGPDLGPLGGLDAALHHGRDHGFAAVLTLACDTPLLSDEAFRRLCATRTASYLADGPVIGLWPCALADELDDHLRGGDRSMRGWARRVGAQPIALDRPIDNVNTPEDLRRLAIRSDRAQPFAPGFVLSSQGFSG